MAMDAGSAVFGTGMSGAIYVAMQALPFFVSGTAGQAFCDALATALVTYITTNAVVVPTALVAPPGGGPVVGAGTIT